MKIADAKKVAALVDKLADCQKQIDAVRTKSMELNFGGYTFHLATAIESELRARIAESLEPELEKLRAELTSLGVEL